MEDRLWTDEEWRAQLSSAEINDLPDSAFAYIEDGGEKDAEGKTTPRSKRHYPVQDKPHARNALQRARAQIKAGAGAAAKIAKSAMPKILAACKKFGIAVSEENARILTESRDGLTDEQRASYKAKARAIGDAIASQPDAGRLSAYLDDFDDKNATYYSGQDMFQVPYKEADDGSITLGKSQKVQPKVTYEPVGRSAGGLEGRARKLTVQHNPDGTMQAWADDDEDHDDPDGKKARAATVEMERRKATVESMLQRRTFERRSADTGPVEIRESDDGKLHISGYASVFDRPYDVGFYKETIKRGAFKKTLAEGAQVHLLLNHGGLPLASTLNDTLQLREDPIGLRFDAELDPDDPDSQAAVRKIRSGLLQQCSFAFQPVRQSWNNDYTERDIQEASIDRGDVSVVNFGASPTTSVTARGALEDFERQAVRHALDMIEHEERAGATFSGANLTKLKAILSLVADADSAVDRAQADLSELIGVENPNEPDDGSGAPEDEDRSAVILPDYSAHARLALARARG